MSVTAVDTSVAVPLLMSSHVAHQTVSAWARGRSLALSGHALPETYSVLTRLPGDAKVAPGDAVTLIDGTFDEALMLDEVSAREIHRELARLGIAGGAVYDGLVAGAARAHGAVLATRDARAQATYESMGVRVVVVGA